MHVSLNGFSAGINLPDALVGESLHRLPPYAPAEHYRVSDFPAAPREWSRGDALTATSFVGVKDGSGMWIDLTGNQRLDNHVACIPIVQGVNAITALRAADHPVLEQYRSTCPVHGTAFAGNRHCANCGFDWPGQNYLSSASNVMMWLDGFRTKGGNGQPSAETRQFVFTSDTDRGIAAQVIGDARSFDVKLYFFRGPQKPRPPMRARGGDGMFSLNMSSLESSSSKSVTRGGERAPEVAAGARIRQDVGLDPLSVHQYGELAAVIQVYYVYEDVARQIIGTGRTGEGGLAGLKVGNPSPANPHKVY